MSKLFALIVSCPNVSQNHYIPSKNVILLKLHLLPENSGTQLYGQLYIQVKNYNESVALISSCICAPLYPVTVLIQEAFQHMLTFNYVNNLIPPWQALEQRLKGKHGLVLNEGLDFHLMFYRTQIYRALKKKHTHKKENKPHNTKPHTGQKD